jgi:hypothetical protein
VKAKTEIPSLIEEVKIKQIYISDASLIQIGLGRSVGK